MKPTPTFGQRLGQAVGLILALTAATWRAIIGG